MVGKLCLEERNVIINCIISAMTTRKMVKKGYETYLTYVIEIKREEIR